MTAARSAIDGPALYSSNIISTFLKLINKKYSYVDVVDLLEYAGMEPYQVNDDGHWFSQRQVDRFYERLVELTQNADIAREAGRFSSSHDNMTLMNRYILTMTDPVKVFEIMGKIAEGYSRSAKYEPVKKSGTEIEITVTPYEGVREKPYQCQNRIGYFEAVVFGLNYLMPKIEHSECLFKGGSACKYRITWKESKSRFLKRIRNLYPLAALAVAPFAFFFLPSAISLPFFGAALLGFGALVLASEFLEKREMKSSLDALRTTMENFFENIHQNYNNALMVNEIGRIISKENQIDALLLQVIETFKLRLDYDRGLIMLASADGRRLEYRSGFGYGKTEFNDLVETSFHLDKPDSKGVFVVCYRDKRPFLINDVDEIKVDLSGRSLEFVKKLGTKAFICCPILYENECLGVLAVDNVKSKRSLLESDMNLLMGIALEIGISVHNALLIEERERQFRSILKTLAASIDARDTLTAGHSDRVTEYCMDICREMGMPADYTEVVRVAAQLHDYGKIGIKDSILKKSGPLSIWEREEIKTHVTKTKSILDQINFTGIYQQVPEIAGAHHEWMDGSGYPKGLVGENIPLGSRIIAVADFYEAITAQRHYRNPMNPEEAIEALKGARGPHLDPNVVDAFLLILDRKKPLQMVG
jgi:HD-GYP domain-containing protein (c-di-GMP phosphodiesterase class II)